MNNPDTNHAQGPASVSSAWSRHPKASIHRHRKRLGLSEDALVSDADAWVARRLSDHTVAAIDGKAMRSCTVALHLLAQALCADEESVIAVLQGPSEQSQETALGLAASYIYAEAEDSMASVHAQVERCLEREIRIAPAEIASFAAAQHLPVFFAVRGVALPPAPVLLALDADGTTLRLRIAPEVRRFPDAATTLEVLEDLLLVLNDADRDIGSLNGSILSRLVLPDIDGIAADMLSAQVAAVWAELLEADASCIRPETSYFELGGTSLNAFKLVAIIRSRFEVEVNIREIIDHDTLAGFTRLIEHKRQDA